MSSARNMPGIGFHLVCLACLCLTTSPSLVDAAGLYDWMSEPTACTSQNAPVSTPDPKPSLPKWPEEFGMYTEANMKEGDWSYDGEEYVDNSTKLTSVFTYVSRVKQQTVFSTDPLESYTIVDEDTCTAKPGRREFHPLAFASITPTTLHPSKMSFGHLFEFGQKGAGGFVYVGQTSARGIVVNHWTSCQEWTDMSAKVQIDFYFSTPGYKSATNEGEMPIRAEVKGTTGLFNTAYIPKNFLFDNLYEFTSFQSGPTYKPSPDDFKIPMRVVCVGRSENKAMPDLPDSFRMDVELSAPHVGSSVPLVTSLRYDWDHQLLESVHEFSRPMGLAGDKKRHKPQSHFGDEVANKQKQTEWITVATYSTVEDYHTGIQYLTEKNNNTCMVRHMPASSTMSQGNTLLRMYNDQKQGLSDMTYQGRSFLRGSPVESWGMDKDGLVQKVFFLARTKGIKDANVDTSNMTEEERKDYEAGAFKLQLANLNKYPVILGIVVRNRTTVSNKHFPLLVNNLISEGVFVWEDDKLKSAKGDDPDNLVYSFLSWTRKQEMQAEHIGELDIFVQHFQPIHLDGDLFHVSQCYKSEEIAKVILTVKVPYDENVLHNPTYFLTPLRTSIARAIGVSMLQISDIQATPVVNLEKNIDVTVVTFNLLGAAPMESNKNEQQDLGTSKKRLVAALQNGITFTAKYTHDSKSFSVDKEYYSIDSTLEDFAFVNQARGATDDDDDNDDDGSKKYSGGVVAGVAVAVAIATCGITVVILFVFGKTRRPDSSPSIPYVVAKE